MIWRTGFATRLLLGGALAMLASSAGFAANIVAVFDTSALSAIDQTTINNALLFYNTNISSNVNLTIAFSSQSGGGAESIKFINTVSYSAYRTDLGLSSSGDATDVTALAHTPTGSTDPVIGSNSIILTNALATLMGLSSAATTAWAQCGGLVANACIEIGSDLLSVHNGGVDSSTMFGAVQHEVDEVLGTSSSLPNGVGTAPGNIEAADLFRYSAPGIRTFTVNNGDTSTFCTNVSTSAAYFSINGGTTNLSYYNNCANGGDYGDWNELKNGFAQVQDAFDTGTATSLTLTSPEVTLLDAVGYTLVTVPEPSSWGLAIAGLAFLVTLQHRRAKRTV